MIRQISSVFPRSVVSRLPLLWWVKVTVRGQKKSPLPQSSPIEGEEVGGRGGILNLFLLFALFLLLTPNQGNSQTKEKVRVALGSISVNTSVIPVGHQYGMFAKYGV